MCEAGCGRPGVGGRVWEAGCGRPGVGDRVREAGISFFLIL